MAGTFISLPVAEGRSCLAGRRGYIALDPVPRVHDATEALLSLEENSVIGARRPGQEIAVESDCRAVASDIMVASCPRYSTSRSRRLYATCASTHWCDCAGLPFSGRPRRSSSSTTGSISKCLSGHAWRLLLSTLQ